MKDATIVLRLDANEDPPVRRRETFEVDVFSVLRTQSGGKTGHGGW
jgi:hypothetical protein